MQRGNLTGKPGFSNVAYNASRKRGKVHFRWKIDYGPDRKRYQRREYATGSATLLRTVRYLGNVEVIDVNPGLGVSEVKRYISKGVRFIFDFGNLTGKPGFSNVADGKEQRGQVHF